ncbi:restriction endonuclease subunit S [Helicobacter pylori]|nr:restriction endonuclease subunit S [Helicobacter pylori]
MDALTTPLPKAWQRVRLGDVGNPCMCKRVMKHQTTRYGEIPFYKIGTFGNTADAFISKKLFLEYKTKYSFPKKGDILISASGTIGRAVIYDGKPAYFQDSNIVWIDNDETLVKNDFLFYVYSHVKWNTEHTTILRLYNDNFRNTLIPLPPLDEQIAIANILSDVDRYLYSLDALILKKESVKKALRIKMLNQILASNGVEFRELGDIILSLKTGLNPRSFFKLNTPNANNYYVTIRELEDYTIKFTHQTDRIDNNALSLCLKRSNLEKDDILFSGTGTIGKVSIIKENPNNWAIKEGIYSIKPNKKIVFPRFLMFCFENLNIQNDIKSKSFGGIVKSIPMNDLQQIQIPLPPLNEQIAIANILSALDHEIISLKNKKRQFDNIKKALNHDLMSAKIRVLKK